MFRVYLMFAATCFFSCFSNAFGATPTQPVEAFLGSNPNLRALYDEGRMVALYGAAGWHCCLCRAVASEVCATALEQWFFDLCSSTTLRRRDETRLCSGVVAIWSSVVQT